MTRRQLVAPLVPALLALLACGGSPRVPDVPRPAPSTFVRGPYLQAVTDSSAVVRWRASREGATASFRYRVGDERREGDVDRAPGGDRVVRLAGLPPAAQVTYRVTEAGRTLGPYRFRTPPRDDSGDEPVRVLAFGDSGWGSREQVTLSGRMTERDWDLAVHVGDLVYPDGSPRGFTTRHFAVYRRLLAETPFYPVPGNHDLRYRGGREYDRSFEWPGTDGRRYYRFRWGALLFVGLDTSTPGQADSLEAGRGEQMRWLRRTLRSAAGDSTLRWTVVFLHHPPYSSAGGLSGHGPSRELRETLVPLFEETGVDLVLAGHDHHYERTHPLRDGDPVPPGCGPVYVVTGGGGASRYARTVQGGPRTAAESRRYHFLDLRFRGRHIAGRVVGLDGEAFDTFRLQPYEAERRREECAA